MGNKIAFIYAGQGSQFEKMGKDLYDENQVFRETFDVVASEKIKNLCFDADLETLSKTENTQPCMVACEIAITDVLKSENIMPQMTAGLSLGEYSALYCADVLTKEKAVELVTFRGEKMAEINNELDLEMHAIVGLNREVIEQCVDKVQNVYIANYNSKEQVVISGEKSACKEVCDLVISKGGKKAIKLNVSSAFHSPFMQNTCDELKLKFTDNDFSDMQIPVVFNTLGAEKSADQKIREIMINQAKSSVYFEDSIKYMIDKGIDTFIEIGGGKTLSSFIKKIDKNVKTYVVDSQKTLENTLQKIKGDV